MKILNQLETIDQSAHELWSDVDVRLAMRTLPTLIRVARAAEQVKRIKESGAYKLARLFEAEDELRVALQQLQEVKLYSFTLVMLPGFDWWDVHREVQQILAEQDWQEGYEVRHYRKPEILPDGSVRLFIEVQEAT